MFSDKNILGVNLTSEGFDILEDKIKSVGGEILERREMSDCGSLSGGLVEEIKYSVGQSVRYGYIIRFFHIDMPGEASVISLTPLTSDEVVAAYKAKNQEFHEKYFGGGSSHE